MLQKSAGISEHYERKHRFEHWYRDNSVYFITSSTRDHFPAFASQAAKSIFWDRFENYARSHGFVPWVTSVLTTHYHFIGYLCEGKQLAEMMRKLHGSVAKLVNDVIPKRQRPFWRDAGGRDYFDGCLRDEKQLRLAYRYTLTQSVRHRIAHDWRQYPHTRVYVELEEGVRRATELRAFLPEVPYARYGRKSGR